MLRKLFSYTLPILFLALFIPAGLRAQNIIKDFSLKNVDGAMLNLSGFSNKKALVIIFTGNHCVYSKKYEDRILRLASDYSPKEVQFLLINSNSPDLSEDDSFEAMQFHSKEKGYTFPYLQDKDQSVAKMFSAQRNPAAFVLVPAPEGFKIVYTGLIDDNPLMEEAVTLKYVASTLDQVLAGNTAPATPTTVQGCGIKGLEE